MDDRARIKALEEKISALRTSNKWFREILDAI